MQISKKRVNGALLKQIDAMWYQLIADIQSPKEAQAILSDLFSETELVVMTKRLAIGYWLSKGRSYENVKENLKVSSATIAAVQKDMAKPGWKTAIKKVVADEWATKWDEKIKSFLNSKKK